MQPQPGPPRHTARSNVGIPLAIGGAILFGLILMVAVAGGRSATPVPAAPPASTAAAVLLDPTAGAYDRCANAVIRVQEYKAPGSRATVMDNVVHAVSTSRRPIQLEGWTVKDNGLQCLVTLTATIGNETQTFMWAYLPEYGSVSAWDDATKRISGW